MNSPATLLIVDDHASNRDTLTGLLDSPDYRLVEAADGPAALKLAADLQPDLILLDVMMPGMDGFEVCRRLRTDPRLAEVPVIMVTALDDRQSRITGIESGADDFVSKPFDRAELRARVKTIARLNRFRRLHEQRAQLRESEERFRLLAERSGDGFWFAALNPERILYVSPAMEKIWGLPAGRFYQEASVWTAAIHPDDRPRAQSLWEGLPAKPAAGSEVECRVVRPDGSARWVLANSTPIFNDAGEITRIGGTVKDITEFKQNEKQRLRTQRLEAIGTLASGVAHDLNNALAPILMGVELLKMQYPEGLKNLDMFEASARRGADMVRQLLGFAKGVEGERVCLNLAHLIKEMQKLMKGTFPKNIRLAVKCDPKLPAVLGDATQLHQVLLNLCVNARDAMPQGGTLSLDARGVEVDASYASAVPDAKPGRYLALQVRDTGTGIPPEILDRIFDPFFTTKGPNQGTGLGLSTVLGIVKGHGGFLQVNSHPGQGSTFTAYLPADHTGGGTEAGTTAAAEFRGQGETILLVDDEPVVREVARAVLRRLNFNPLTATDGTDGLIQAAQHRTELRAIITDLLMPHLDGLGYVRAVRRMLPDIPIMVASGRWDDAMAGEFETLGVTNRLDKPFTEAQLAEALKHLLAPT